MKGSRQRWAFLAANEGLILSRPTVEVDDVKQMNHGSGFMQRGNTIKNRSQIVLLAPQFEDLPFQNVITDGMRHRRLLSNAQQLRGKTYLKDSAINPWDLSLQGRHIQPADNASWHVLMVDHDDQVTGCLRYRKHRRNVAFSELSLAGAAVSNSCNYGGLVRDAVPSLVL